MAEDGRASMFEQRAGSALYQNVSCSLSCILMHILCLVSCGLDALGFFTSGLRPIPPGMTTMTTTSDGE